MITNIGCELTTHPTDVLAPSGRGRGSADVRASGADVVEFAISRTGGRSQVVAACVWVDYLILKFNKLLIVTNYVII